jgi:putative two-component system response regulator
MNSGQNVDNGLKTILVVDDTPENIAVLGELLSPSYRVRVAPSGAGALRIVTTDPRPDLLLLDVMMPGMDGYEVLRRIRAQPETADIPVIFVTAMDSPNDEEHGLSLGAVDYITKPIKPAIVLARVRAQLELKQARDWLKNQNTYLEAEVERRMHDNQLIQDVSIRALASLAETRDTETGNHIRRTQDYVEILARTMSRDPRFSKLLNPTMMRMIVKSAPLHDIGKVGIPDHILLKPGKLNAEEFEAMKTHSRIGGDAIDMAMRSELTDEEYDVLRQHFGAGRRAEDQAIEEIVNIPLSFLSVAKDIALYHHERWDGRGYPEGLVGDDIPLAARIMSLSDVFDALTSQRIYKPALPFDESVAMISAASGKQFDPDVVAAFLSQLKVFRAISERYADNDPSLLENTKPRDLSPRT